MKVKEMENVNVNIVGLNCSGRNLPWTDIEKVTYMLSYKSNIADKYLMGLIILRLSHFFPKLLKIHFNRHVVI